MLYKRCGNNQSCENCRSVLEKYLRVYDFSFDFHIGSLHTYIKSKRRREKLRKTGTKNSSRKGGRGWARSRIIRLQESLLLYKSFNTLCIHDILATLPIVPTPCSWHICTFIPFKFSKDALISLPSISPSY